MKNQPVALEPVNGAATPIPIDPSKILRSIVDVVCVVDAQGIFRYVSPSAEQLFGYTAEEMTGASFRRFIHPDDVEKTIAITTAHGRDCSTSNFENRYFRKDGTLAPIIWSGRWDTTDGLLYCVARDGAPLREVEQRLVKAQQMARVANFEFDVAHQYYTYTSDTLFEIFGLDRAVHPRLTPELYWSMIHPDDLAYVRENTLTPEHVYSPTLDYRIVRPDGAVVYLHRLREIVRDASGMPVKVIGTLQDITARKHSELALQQSEERLQYLVQNGNDLIAVLDEQGTYTLVGSNVEQHLGYSAEDMLGQNALSFAHPDDVPALTLALQDSVHRDTFTVGPFRYKHKQGCWRWVETTVSNHLAHPSLSGLVVNSRDVTDKKLREDALRQSEQRFKALVFHGADIVTIVDAQAQFHYVSDNVPQIVGYSPDELLGRSVFDYIHPDDAGRVGREMKTLLEGTSSEQGVQYRFRQKDGGWLWLESKGRNHQGNESIQGLLINSRNIDDRVKLQKRLDEELRNKQKEITKAVIRAQEAERSQLGLELHDNVNQVLTTVKLYNEMFLSGVVTNKELLLKSTAYVQDCINEIRSISRRLSTPTLGKISLKDSIRELVESVNLSQRLTVLYQPCGIDRCPVPEELHLSVYRIVQESLNNIIKYSGARQATVTLCRQAGALRLEVSDNGKGFDTTARREGIGITNMRTRAENLNASFRLVSAPGKGCTVEIRFPMESETATHHRTAVRHDAPAKALHQQGAHIREDWYGGSY